MSWVRGIAVALIGQSIVYAPLIHLGVIEYHPERLIR